MNLRGKAGANEGCRGARMQRMRKVHVCHSQCMGFSALQLLQIHTRTKFIAPEAHFHTETISASPVVIARKTVEVIQVFPLTNST